MNRHLTEANKPKKRVRIFHGRMYFALQALAGAAWWLGTAMIPGVATATLGSINPLLIAFVDIPLFVIGSALAALNFRWAVWIVTAWTVLVALGMVIYATATTEAGLGAVLMILAALGSLLAGVLMIVGRIPSEKLLIGPFAFHSSHTRVRSRVLVHTTIQIVVFWGIFLIIILFKVINVGSLAGVSWFVWPVAAVIVLLFTALVTLILRRKIVGIDTNESLKANE